MARCPNCLSDQFHLSWLQLSHSLESLPQLASWSVVSTALSGPHPDRTRLFQPPQLVQVSCHHCHWTLQLDPGLTFGPAQARYMPLFGPPDQVYSGPVRAEQLHQLACQLVQLLQANLAQPRTCLNCDQPRWSASPYFCRDCHQAWQASHQTVDQFTAGRTAAWRPVRWGPARSEPTDRSFELSRIDWDHVLSLIYSWLDQFFQALAAAGPAR